MQVAITGLACVVTAAAALLTLADYSHPPAETPRGLLFARLGLEDDFWSIEQMRPRVAAIGYASARNILGPVLDRDASSAYRWTDLGEVLTSAGDLRQAEYCYRMAGELAPYDPQILSAVAAFHAMQGETQEAVRTFASILTLPRSNEDSITRRNVFVYYERLGIRSKHLLGQAIPDASAARDYLRFLIAESPNDPGAAAEVWRWMSGRSYGDESLTIDFVNFLFTKKQFDAAEDAWITQYAGRRDGYSRQSPVFNGGFEYEWTGAIPDWRSESLNGVSARRDRAPVFDGRYSLRIDFTGNDNPDFHHIEESVFVQPGEYRLEAHVMTRDITSEQGIRVRVVSTDGRVLGTTEDMIGTNDWKRLETAVSVPSGVRVVRLQIARRRSIRIDNQLTGTAWVDAVKLTRIP